MKNLLVRKLLVTILTSFTFSAGLLIIQSFESIDIDTEFTWGGYFFSLIALMLIYSFYSGLIILFFGNLVSIILELLLKKLGKKGKLSKIIYILFHGLFGLLIGEFLQGDNWEFGPLGGAAALIYGLIDVWVCSRFNNGKGISILPIIVMVVLIFGTLILL